MCAHLDVLPAGEEVELVPRGLAVTNEDELGVRRARRELQRERPGEQRAQHIVFSPKTRLNQRDFSARYQQR